MTEREAFEAWCEREKISGAPWNGIRIVAQAAWEAAWQAARAQPAQAVPLLSDEDIKATALEAFDCTWDADDETLVNKYGHGVYLWRFVDFTRAIEQAVLAKLLGKEGA